MSYATAAMVRQLYRALSVDVISDADLLSLGDVYAQPVIDAALDGPITTPIPSLIQVAWCLLTAARAFDDRFWQISDYSGIGQKLREEAMDLIAKLKSGELSISGLTYPLPIAAMSPDEPRLAQEVFVNGEMDWRKRIEERES